MVREDGITTGVRGKARKRILQLHRLLVFEQTFNDYLAGKCSAERVTNRARKMLECGLPNFKTKG